MAKAEPPGLHQPKETMLYKKQLTGSRVGVVIGSFAPLHRGHVDQILRAKKENDGGTLVIVTGQHQDVGEQAGMEHTKRYRYVSEHFKNDPLVIVDSLDTTQLESDRSWQKALKKLQTAHVAEGTTLSPALTTDGGAAASASEIRANPLAHWDAIAPPFRRFFTRNVLVMGAASGGKTTLVEDLGKLYNAPYSYEYARVYQVEANIRDEDYDLLDYQNVLTGQFNLNRETIDSPGNRGLALMDTDTMVTKAYAAMSAADPASALSEADYAKLLPLADSLIAKARWDLVLFIPPVGAAGYTHDGFRSQTNNSDDYLGSISRIMLAEVRAAGLTGQLTVLDGKGYAERYEQAKAAIDRLLI
ncbi:AAA family ATPase [Rothia nasisuis]|uniref:AAA family ATPase n=1 Tax=Rothia nasisuis TaxID=2109647 RepID=UPI001F2B0986|nr:AAA family ATPase [Rothia nasisuis]